TNLCFQYLNDFCERVELISMVPGKEYFSFYKNGEPYSRAINQELFKDLGIVNKLFNSLDANKFPHPLTPHEITQATYTLVVSYAAFIDMLKSGKDQKTPGSYFEHVTSFLLSCFFHTLPSKQIKIPLGNTGEKINLTVDLNFIRNPHEENYSIALKTSTRERASEVWVHQRILDEVYKGKFKGLFFGLAETKLDHETRKVIEICVPNQWRIYQQYVSKIDAFYYLDPPQRLLEVPSFPGLNVNEYGKCFFDLT
ncbi:MAG: hypothetical protein JXA91_05570, partial [Candidatus Thermoplasmatota archaeon]|nr:hypothetical protein [Candidatus Thermoplasmatota archaeon]